MLNRKLCNKTRIHNYSISFKSTSNLSNPQKQQQPPHVISPYKTTKESTPSRSNKNSATKATENLSRLSNTFNYYPKYTNTQPNTKISTFICTSPSKSPVNEIFTIIKSLLTILFLIFCLIFLYWCILKNSQQPTNIVFFFSPTTFS